MIEYFKLLRINHWIKNLLIFFPMIFSGNITNAFVLRENIVGFFTFSFLASAIYIFNDFKDVEKDKKHPMKKTRPLAAGTISIHNATGTIVLLIILSGILTIFSKSKDIKYLLFYLVINIIYSIGAKNIPLLDIVILVMGYIVRLFYGGALSKTGVSNWMFLTVLSMAFYLGFGKRCNEIKKYGSQGRTSLEKYTSLFLDKSLQLFSSLTIIFYSLTCADKSTFAARLNADFIWSVPLVIIIFLRYSMLLDSKDCDGDPVEMFFQDNVLKGLTLFYTICCLGLLYWPK